MVSTPAAEEQVDILLIGGGVASAAAADELRTRGFEGSVMLVGRELDAPYRRPPGTKSMLQAGASRDDAAVYPAEWWHDKNVTLRTGTSVMSLDTAARVAELSNRTHVRYGKALIATGAMVRRLRLPGGEAAGIHYIRTLRNAESLRRDLDTVKGPLLCVGGSFIGCEVAASVAERGGDVTMLLMERLPLETHFGEAVGQFVHDHLTARGVKIISSEQAGYYTRAEDARVDGVTTGSGIHIPARTIVCGVGATPDIALARKAGLQLGETGGVVCDTYLRTSAEDIYAAGDMCEFDSVFSTHPVRLEHEDVAETQARCAAANMMGAETIYDAVPYFWSEIGAALRLDFYGYGRGWTSYERVGPPDGDSFSIHYKAGDRLVAELSVNRDSDRADAVERIRHGWRA